MDFRIIPIKKRKPNKYNSEETFVIPVRVIEILEKGTSGPLVSIIIERLDFLQAK